MENETRKIIENLSDFNLEKRKLNFLKLIELIKRNKIEQDNEYKNWFNLHIHTFHSFNYKNWSPLRIVFEGWLKGLSYIGTVDFDNLEGLEETIWAGELLKINVISGFETRVFLKELKDKVINSPNEPGIFYLCGKGFKKLPSYGSKEYQFLLNIKNIAQNRNRKVIQKLNEYLKEVNVNYEKDVLPLTPSNNPTERHIILAFYKKSKEIMADKSYNFWSEILKIDISTIKSLEKESPGELFETIRQKLIKIGGPGYIKGESSDFPLFDDVVEMIEKSGGIPIGTWLDGTNEGEKDSEFLVELLKSKRIKGITIIPERNWNIKNKEEKIQKLKNLNDFIETCKKKEMPVICGTEMNKYGQPFVDNFNTPEISLYFDYFFKSCKKLFES